MRTSIASVLRANPGVVGDASLTRAAFVCRKCLGRTIPTTPVVQKRGYAAREPLTERLRKRIWGGDAPGPANVYGEPKLFPIKNRQQADSEPEPAAQEEELEELEDPEQAFEAISKTRRVHEALTEDVAERTDTSYRKAQTLEELKTWGATTSFGKPAAAEIEEFTAWRPARSPSAFTQPELFNLLRRAYIEAYALDSAGIADLDVSRLPTEDYLPFHKATIKVVDGRSQIDVVPVEWHDEIVRLANIAQEPPRSDIESLKTTVAESEPDQQAPWLGIPLDSVSIKFSVVKRIKQLTGARISDAVVSNAKTLGAVLADLQQREPPKNTFAALNTRSRLIELPNVQVYGTRQTWVDKEMRLGRYKRITEALTEKGLPLPGARRRRARHV